MAGSYRCNHVTFHASSPALERLKLSPELHAQRLRTPCMTMIVGYRSCGYAGCKVEAGYCNAHGGDKMAISVIQTHMRDVHSKGIPSV